MACCRGSSDLLGGVMAWQQPLQSAHKGLQQHLISNVDGLLVLRSAPATRLGTLRC